MTDLIRHFEHQQIKDTDRPRVATGDIVRVETKIKEGDKERLQSFEGTVLGVRGSGPSVTITVRREVGRFAVERIFPLYSPLITSIEILKRQKVRRAKLGYLREAGRRRVKEDERAMQRHVDEEAAKKRLAEEAKRRAEEKKRQEDMAAKRAEEAKQKEAAEKKEAEAVSEDTPKAEAKDESQPADKPTEEPKPEDKN